MEQGGWKRGAYYTTKILEHRLADLKVYFTTSYLHSRTLCPAWCELLAPALEACNTRFSRASRAPFQTRLAFSLSQWSGLLILLNGAPPKPMPPLTRLTSPLFARSLSFFVLQSFLQNWRLPSPHTLCHYSLFSRSLAAHRRRKILP